MRFINRSPIIFPIFYMAFIFLLSSVPLDEADKLGGIIYIRPTIQNLLHIPLYAILSWLWLRSFLSKTSTCQQPRAMSYSRAISYTLFITIFYSIFDEFHQFFVPGRYASLGDFFFNIAGCLGGVIVYKLVS